MMTSMMLKALRPSTPPTPTYLCFFYLALISIGLSYIH